MDHVSSSRRGFGSSAAVNITATIMVVAVIVLFVVVVFVIGLHLFAKWFWWRGEDYDPNLRQSRRHRRRFVFAAGQDHPVSAQRRGLEPSILRSIPVLVFRPGDFKDGLECAVCLSEVAEGEKARLLPKCNHGFHVDCIDMWFQSHSTCPLCRNPIAVESSTSSAPILEQNIVSLEENPVNGTGSSSESPNFPTNVLFWGDDTQVSSRTAGTEECPSSSSTSGSNRANNGTLVIDIPRRMGESLSPLSPPPGGRSAEEEGKSPVTARLRSFRRLLSREKRSNPCSPVPLDIEQQGRPQS